MNSALSWNLKSRYGHNPRASLATEKTDGNHRNISSRVGYKDYRLKPAFSKGEPDSDELHKSRKSHLKSKILSIVCLFTISVRNRFLSLSSVICRPAENLLSSPQFGHQPLQSTGQWIPILMRVYEMLRTLNRKQKNVLKNRRN